jgi:hypothetical protein
VTIFLTALVCTRVMGGESYDSRSVTELIDELVKVDKPTVGLDGLAQLEGFLPVENEGTYSVGVLGAQPPSTMPEMRELIRRGANALPLLVQHIDDTRPTNLWVGRAQPYFVKFFLDEYDQKVRNPGQIGRQTHMTFGQKPIASEYNIRVGDVCYAIIGQIVNRRLLAVRYQPSGIIIVNSPVEVSTLAEQVKKDWSGATEDDLRKSLIEDAKDASGSLTNKQAMIRLNFYFPDTNPKLKAGSI